MGFAIGNRIYVHVGSHLSFLCVDLQLEMYVIGVPKGCVVVLYLGCRVEFRVVGGGGGWYVVCV